MNGAGGGRVCIFEVEDDRARGLKFISVNGLVYELCEPQPSWECINSYGATVYDGLRRNEAELIARQHGLTARVKL